MGAQGQSNSTQNDSKVGNPTYSSLFWENDCSGKATSLSVLTRESPGVKAVVKQYIPSGHRWEMDPRLVGRQWGSGLSVSALRHCRVLSVGSQRIAYRQDGQK